MASVDDVLRLVAAVEAAAARCSSAGVCRVFGVGVRGASAPIHTGRFRARAAFVQTCGLGGMYVPSWKLVVRRTNVSSPNQPVVFGFVADYLARFLSSLAY